MIPKFFISKNGFGNVEIRFGGWIDDQRFLSAKPVQIEIQAVDRSNVLHSDPPMMEFHGEDGSVAIQSLMDQLWSMGVRPADVGTAGHLAATTKHLEDMRAIAFSHLEVPKP